MIYGYSPTSYPVNSTVVSAPKQVVPVVETTESGGPANISRPHDTRTLAEVVADARRVLDEGYAKLGKTADFSTAMEDWYTAGLAAWIEVKFTL